MAKGFWAQVRWHLARGDGWATPPPEPMSKRLKECRRARRKQGRQLAVLGEKLRAAEARARPRIDTEEYRAAVNSNPDEAEFGTVAYDWHDKPHRLVYDLCAEIDRLTEEGDREPE